MAPGTLNMEGERMLEAVAAALGEHGVAGWLVGGSVRDRELGRFSPDIDVVVTGDARAVAQSLAGHLGAPWFTLSEEFRAYRVVGATAHVDVAAVRGGDILADLGERDFTVNAMAKPVGGDGSLGALVDPFAGMSDLRAMRLRGVSERIFLDDPLRLMRAARFAHVFGLSPEPTLVTVIQEQAGEIRRAAPERTLTEMILTLEDGRSGDAARLWDGLGLLGVLAPEIGDIDRGSLFSSLDRLEAVLTDPARASRSAAEALTVRMAEPVDGASSRATALRLACLLRGVAPERALKTGRRLRLSSAMISLLNTAARMAGWGPSPAPSSGDRPGRETVLFLWAAMPWEPEVILLAEVAAASGEAGTAGLLAVWAARESAGVPRLPFDGEDLMEELGLEPGPRLGQALRAARLAWESGEALAKEEALAAARVVAAEG